MLKLISNEIRKRAIVVDALTIHIDIDDVASVYLNRPVRPERKEQKKRDTENNIQPYRRQVSRSLPLEKLFGQKSRLGEQQPESFPESRVGMGQALDGFTEEMPKGGSPQLGFLSALRAVPPLKRRAAVSAISQGSHGQSLYWDNIILDPHRRC